MTGQFHCNIFLLEKEWPTVVSIVNCRSFLWFKDSCSLLTRKAQAWLAGSWCVGGTWVGGLLIQSADLHLFPLFPWRLLAFPFARWGVPKSRTSELQSLLLVLGRHSHQGLQGWKGAREGPDPWYKLAFLLSLRIALSTNFRAFLRFSGLAWLLVERVSPLWSLTF